MTYEAEQAVEIAYRLEGKKDSLRQTQDNGVKVTFSIHPQDMHPALYSDPMGQRYVIVIVPIDDNEQPKQNEVQQCRLSQEPASTASPCDKGLDSRKDSKSIAQTIGGYCAWDEFQEFLGVSDAENAARIVREKCGVTSRKEIQGGDALAAWKTIERAFQDWQFEQRYK